MGQLKHLPVNEWPEADTRPSAPPMSLETCSTRPLDPGLTFPRTRAK
jgi:hypothetical protein